MDKAYLRGLAARGGLTMDIFWDNCKLEKVIIHSRFNNNKNIIYQDNAQSIDLKKNQSFIYTQ